jgi:hypothetical protein
MHPSDDGPGMTAKCMEPQLGPQASCTFVGLGGGGGGVGLKPTHQKKNPPRPPANRGQKNGRPVVALRGPPNQGTCPFSKITGAPLALVSSGGCYTSEAKCQKYVGSSPAPTTRLSPEGSHVLSYLCVCVACYCACVHSRYVRYVYQLSTQALTVASG